MLVKSSKSMHAYKLMAAETVEVFSYFLTLAASAELTTK